MNVGALKPTSFLFLSKLAASCNRFIEERECKISMNVGALKPTSFLFLSKLAASWNRFIVGHE